MAKVYAEIGFEIVKETAPGVWTPKIIERAYYGDATRIIGNHPNGLSINDNLQVNNIISIVADPFAFNNFAHMRYIFWMGNKWKITSAEVQYPRLLLSIGGVYNAEEI